MAEFVRIETKNETILPKVTLSRLTDKIIISDFWTDCQILTTIS